MRLSHRCPRAAAVWSRPREDYLRFAQMLLNGGELDGVRILAPATVQLMTTNHLAPGLMTGEFSIGPVIMRPGLGWGYDCAVLYGPARSRRSGGRRHFLLDRSGGHLVLG